MPLLSAVLVLDVGHLALVLVVQHDVQVGGAAKVQTEETLQKRLH